MDFLRVPSISEPPTACRRPVQQVGQRAFVCFTRRSSSRGLLGPKLDSPLSKEEEMKVPIWVWVLVAIILVIVIVRLV